VSAIEKTFSELARDGSGALIPYVCACDPDEHFTVELVKALVGAGADIVELGVPFSDPVADGPVIQKAMQRSLSNGFQVARIFDLVSKLEARASRSRSSS